MKREKIEKEVRDWYLEYREATERLKKLKQTKELIDKKVERFLDSIGEGELFIEATDETIICRRVLRKEVVFEPEKLERKIDDKSILDKIINKTYLINDWKKFAKYLKSKGIKAKDVVKFIDVQKEVDNNQIDQLEEIGLITYDNIRGCFYCKDISSYIRYSTKR